VRVAFLSTKARTPDDPLTLILSPMKNGGEEDLDGRLADRSGRSIR
jgi:hypothetical protein